MNIINFPAITRTKEISKGDELLRSILTVLYLPEIERISALSMLIIEITDYLSELE